MSLLSHLRSQGGEYGEPLLEAGTLAHQEDPFWTSYEQEINFYHIGAIYFLGLFVLTVSYQLTQGVREDFWEPKPGRP